MDSSYDNNGSSATRLDTDDEAVRESATTLLPLPPRPRSPDEDERRQHKASCKVSRKEALVIVPDDAKEKSKQKVVEDDPHATDIEPHHITFKKKTLLDTRRQFHGSHWQAHRARIGFDECLAEKGKAPEQVHEATAVADSSNSHGSGTSSARRPRPTHAFTPPLIIRLTEMFNGRSIVASPSEAEAAAAKARDEIAANLEKMARDLEAQGRYATVLEAHGDGITSEELAKVVAEDEDSDADDADVPQGGDPQETLPRSPPSSPEPWVPRKRTREDVDAFNAFFSRMPLPPTPPHPKGKVRMCKLGKDALQPMD